LNEAFLKSATGLFDEAEAIAEDDARRFRVQVARLPIEYVLIATGFLKGQKRADLIRQFLKTARAAGVSHISEGQGLEEWAASLHEKGSGF
jgi:hypothetical protein